MPIPTHYAPRSNAVADVRRNPFCFVTNVTLNFFIVVNREAHLQVA